VAAASFSIGTERRVAQAGARTMRCGRCRREYAEAVWGSLELVERLVPARIRSMVTSWPDDVAIDIRRCHACQGVIARKSADIPELDRG
jgi:hypothetical protein